MGRAKDMHHFCVYNARHFVIPDPTSTACPKKKMHLGLQHGTSVLSRKLLYSIMLDEAGRGTLMAPAALQQMRYSVLRCIGQLADIGQGSSVWKGMSDKVAEAAALYLDISQATAVKDSAAEVSQCACTVDICHLDPV